ncbi:MAG: 50S ribosomal protein L9 [Campylobacterales bacterium]|nr:50S ribosomal protein L9 [Campylobacterales bacterium]
MKVLLIKDVKSLGKAGEIKEVKEGYGQNFLVGKGLAKVATNEVIKQYEANKKKKEAADAAHLEEMEKASAKLKNESVKIKHKAGDNGHLFGAVKKEDIAEALNALGYKIDKKMVEIKTPIKETGTFTVSIKLGHGMHPEVTVIVEGTN